MGLETVAPTAQIRRGARRELDEKTAPLAGLVAAFIFAVQMLNFPVAGGTSGHFLGATLAAVLLGPWERVESATLDVLERAGGRPGHIFNLGHGVVPDTDPDALGRLVELVHEKTLVAA